MSSVKVGDRLTIHCYKHNGQLDRISDEAIVLDVTDDLLVVGNYKTILIENDGRSHKTNEPAVIFFYKKRWFNIIGQLKKQGLFYYCNLATPYLIDEGIIKYIDYDLDLRVFPDGGFKVLDRNEYKYHRKLMNYPEEIDLIIRNELTSLIEMKRSLVGPFAPGIVNQYYEKYKNIKKMQKK
jgi:protein associated with RNAse G/E